MGKMDELGVRPVMSRTKLTQVFRTLHDQPRELDGDYKLRQAWVMEQLETRRPIAVAEAVRDLTWHRHRKRLTQKDESLLSHGRELLANEMALATDTEVVDVQQTIETVLTAALASEGDGQVGMREAGVNPAITPEALAQKHFSAVAGD
jgi:RNA polymerase-interacting CarD/CdnL/TRCF family regulator